MLKLKTTIHLLFAFILVTPLASCSTIGSAYKWGYGFENVRDKYLWVNEDLDSLGYQRLKQLMGFNDSIKGFVNHHGLPDMTCDFADEDNYGIRLYYMEKGEVYIFQGENGQISAWFLLEHRKVTDEEINIYCYLPKG